MHRPLAKEESVSAVLFGCLVGPVIGAAIALAFVVVVVLPWETRTDPQGFNYFIGPEMLLIILLGAGIGCLGGFIAQARIRRRTTMRLLAKPLRPLPPDDKIWPPPPDLPAV